MKTLLGILVKVTSVLVTCILVAAAFIFVVSLVADKKTAVGAYNTVTTEGGWATGVSIDGIPSYIEGIQDGLAANDTAKDKAAAAREAADRAKAYVDNQ